MSYLVNQRVLLGLLTGTWVRGFLQEQKWLKVASPNTSPTKPTAPKARNLEHSVHSLQAAQTGWEMSFPGASVGLNLNQAVLLVSVSLRKAVLIPESILCCFSALRVILAACLPFTWEGLWTLTFNSGREGPNGSGHFRDFLKLLNCLPSCLRILLVGWDVLISEKTVTQYSTPFSSPHYFLSTSSHPWTLEGVTIDVHLWLGNRPPCHSNKSLVIWSFTRSYELKLTVIYGCRHTHLEGSWAGTPNPSRKSI